MKIKTGDIVRVLTGKQKGTEGKVIQTLPGQNMVVVDGVRKTTKHIKRRGEQAGQKVTYFAPIRAENVALVSGGTAGRVGYSIGKDGKKVRVVKKAKKSIEIG